MSDIADIKIDVDAHLWTGPSYTYSMLVHNCNVFNINTIVMAT
jgi:hypothetical protein